MGRNTNTISGEPSPRTARAKLPRHAGPSPSPDLPAGRRVILPPWGDQHPDHRIPTFLEAVFFESHTPVSAKQRHNA